MFTAPPFLKNAHIQTLFASIKNRINFLPKVWERLELPDGDFLDLCWHEKSHGEINRPIALILHGLEGSVYSPYMYRIMIDLERKGMRPVAMHFRGCSGEHNRLDRNYHSGDSQDFDFVVNMLKNKYPECPLYGIGYSMGGNVLLKWLGEQERQQKMQAAVAISPPFELAASANRITEGFSRFYQWILIDSLRQKIASKFKDRKAPFDMQKVSQTVNFWQFDDLVTAPVNGFKDVHEYYKVCSCRSYIKSIETPTLIIHAEDDPFIYPEFIPAGDQLSDSVTLECSKNGGHVGFQTGFRCNWLQDRVYDFLSNTPDCNLI